MVLGKSARADSIASRGRGSMVNCSSGRLAWDLRLHRLVPEVESDPEKILPIVDNYTALSSNHFRDWWKK
jgi:hypothetical protein